MTYARISITLPEALLTATDRRAKEFDRPRSWVVAEALRRYLDSVVAAPSRADSPAGPSISEPAPAPYAAEAVAAARFRHLEAELRLTPAERLRRADELARLARERQYRGTRHQIIGFDTYEDYYEWKKAHRAGA